tara:strand:- start:401 stop:1585 length:1185 start_codon:yes stop_codon:yes gene_type:complete
MSTYSNLAVELIGTGEQSGTWGTTTNVNLGTALEEAIVGTTTIAVTASDLTLSLAVSDNGTQPVRHLRLNLTGSSGGASNLIIPTTAAGGANTFQKNYIINNASNTAITVKTASGTGALVPAGKSACVYADGTNVDYAIDYLSGSVLSSDVDINGGTIDGTTIGAATPSTGSFTTLAASGAVSGAGVIARFASPGPIGDVAPSTGSFSTLAASGAVSGAGFTARFASPGAIGNTAPSTGAFTTLAASSTVSGAGFTARFATPGPIGNTSADTGAFTSLSTSLNLVVNGQGYSPTLTLTDGATIDWNTDSGQVAKVTLAGNRTLNAPTNLENGAYYGLQIIQDGTGGRTLAFNAVFKFAGGTAPTLSTAANAIDFLNFRSDGTNLYEQGQTLGVA